MDNDDHVPDDMSEWLRKSVNRKPYALEDVLKDALNDLERDITILEPDPVDWGGWDSYMLEQLEGEGRQ